MTRASEIAFVWLNIACIDQTPGSLAKAREIGQQAEIFRGAAGTFVWLQRVDIEALQSLLYELCWESW